MDPSRRLWPRADLRAGDADRQAVISELQRHYVEGRLTSEELGERVSQALNARTFGDLAALLTDLPAPSDSAGVSTTTSTAPDHEGWPSGWSTPPFGLVLMLIGLVALLAIITMPGMHLGFFPLPLLIWGFFFIGRPHRRRRF